MPGSSRRHYCTGTDGVSDDALEDRGEIPRDKYSKGVGMRSYNDTVDDITAIAVWCLDRSETKTVPCGAVPQLFVLTPSLERAAEVRPVLCAWAAKLQLVPSPPPEKSRGPDPKLQQGTCDTKAMVGHPYNSVGAAMAVSPASVKTSRPSQPQVSWEAMAERWGVSPDLWDLAALLHHTDLPLSREVNGKAEAMQPRRVVDLELQEAELRASEALKKRLETQVAILDDEISRLKESLGANVLRLACQRVLGQPIADAEAPMPKRKIEEFEEIAGTVEISEIETGQAHGPFLSELNDQVLLQIMNPGCNLWVAGVCFRVGWPGVWKPLALLPGDRLVTAGGTAGTVVGPGGSGSIGVLRS
eukprot:Skav219795  [mRNA]  locus=scaffold147:81447:86747:- [translate_table: standard]